MNDDLISRKRLKEAIHTDFAEHFTLYHDSDQTALIDMVMDDIDEAQTAFDKEKVIEELNEKADYARNRWLNSTKEGQTKYWEGKENGIREAIEIVEKGGIE